MVPWRVSLLAFVYGPEGLNTKKVRRFLSRDDELVGQLADYADKTAKTEALIAELSSPETSNKRFNPPPRDSLRNSVSISKSPEMRPRTNRLPLYSELSILPSPDMIRFPPKERLRREKPSAWLAPSGRLAYGSPLGWPRAARQCCWNSVAGIP